MMFFRPQFSLIAKWLQFIAVILIAIAVAHVQYFF
jgi:hypothetical protein